MVFNNVCKFEKNENIQHKLKKIVSLPISIFLLVYINDLFMYSNVVTARFGRARSSRWFYGTRKQMGI